MARRLAAAGVGVAMLAGSASGAWHYFNDSNAVNGCGMSCTNHGTYVCLGTVSTMDDCIALCAQSSICHVLTWSSTSHNCWSRSQDGWNKVGAPGDVAGCNDEYVSDCAPQPPWNGTNITVSISTNTVLARTDALAPAVTLDFWRWDDKTFGEKWRNSSAIEIDLAHPQLQALTVSLSPGLIRLGGSPEDSVIYDADGTCVPQSGGNGPAPDGYYCSQVKPYSYDCLTPKRWGDLLAFADSVGMKIVLGLNGCYGRMSSNTSMDFSNVAALLADTVKSPHVGALWGFELTNEVVPNTISPGIWGKDAATIKGMVTSAFTGAGLPVPNLAGPDQGGCTALGDVAATTPAGTLSALTYHQYPQCVDPVTPDGFALDPLCLAQVDAQASQCVQAASVAAPGPGGKQPAVWAGETADHSGGGIANLTDTFRSSFYYAWQLGALPVNGVTLGARQCLSGGDYELLQRADFGSGLFAPNPDYFILWLYKALIGGGAAAYPVQQSVNASASGVRVFAFSASQGSGATTALLAINLQDGSMGGPAPGPISLNLEGNGIAGRARTEFHLTGDPTIPHGRVYCNGVPLTIDPATHAPPPWQSLGKAQPGGSPLVIAPTSIVFATLQ